MHLLLIVSLICFTYSAEENNETDFTIADPKTLESKDHQFKAEINQLMSLIVNSLYSNREIFLRELISNAADALDKIRYLSLTDPSQLGNNPALEIKIRLDTDKKLLHIRDTGVGMTQEELVNNLGSIAKSGTKEFLKKIQAGSSDLSQIGQFGVGFYSAFLVADKVTVTSKSNNDSQYIWESSMGEGAAFTIAKDPRGDTLGRGTLVTLHLKEDAQTFTVELLKQLVHRYNEFITFPIYLWEQHSEEVPEEKTEATEKDKVEVEEAEEAEESEEETPKPKTKLVWGWSQLNSVKPLWTRDKSTITKEEYNKFYTEVTKDTSEPLVYTHFKAEGDVEFNALLYVPDKVNPYGAPTEDQSGVKLYVKRVFISDKFDTLLPSWLNWIRGIVDSDDLSLNVSRELLQKSKTLLDITRKLVRKIIALFQEMSQSEDKELWEKFYKDHHSYLKIGSIKDTGNRVRLMKLLRFYSAKNPEEQISLEHYVKDMKEGQKDIYFLGGENKESIISSPHLERLVKKGYDVLLFTEPVDEYWAGHVQKFEDHKFVDVSKEGLKLDDDDAEKLKALKEEFQPLTSYLSTVLKDSVQTVEVTSRLTSSPCALVSASWGMSANLERIVSSQPMNDKNVAFQMKAKKNFEINPRHPIIKQLLATVKAEQQNEETENMARVLLDSASIASGYSIKEPASVAKRLHQLVAQGLGVDPSAVVEEEEEEVKKPDTKESEVKDTENQEL